MTTRKYYDQNDGIVLNVDSDGPADNGVLFYIRAEECVALNKQQVENLTAFLRGERQPTVKLWEDVDA